MSTISVRITRSKQSALQLGCIVLGVTAYLALHVAAFSLHPLISLAFPLTISSASTYTFLSIGTFGAVLMTATMTSATAWLACRRTFYRYVLTFGTPLLLCLAYSSGEVWYHGRPITDLIDGTNGDCVVLLCVSWIVAIFLRFWRSWQLNGPSSPPRDVRMSISDLFALCATVAILVAIDLKAPSSILVVAERWISFSSYTDLLSAVSVLLLTSAGQFSALKLWLRPKAGSIATKHWTIGFSLILLSAMATFVLISCYLDFVSPTFEIDDYMVVFPLCSYLIGALPTAWICVSMLQSAGFRLSTGRHPEVSP